MKNSKLNTWSDNNGYGNVRFMYIAELFIYNQPMIFNPYDAGG